MKALITDEVVETVAGEVHGEPPDDPEKLNTWEGRERKIRQALELVEEDLIDEVVTGLLKATEMVGEREVIRNAAARLKGGG